MSTIIAVGGLDEAFIGLSYVLFFGLLAMTSALSLFLWVKRSLVAAIAAFVMLSCIAALLRPWSFVASRTPDGPYTAGWQANMRVLSAIWALLLLFNLAGSLRAIRHRRSLPNADTQG
jgi:hypothetical protein